MFAWVKPVRNTSVFESYGREGRCCAAKKTTSLINSKMRVEILLFSFPASPLHSDSTSHQTNKDWWHSADIGFSKRCSSLFIVKLEKWKERFQGYLGVKHPETVQTILCNKLKTDKVVCTEKCGYITADILNTFLFSVAVDFVPCSTNPEKKRFHTFLVN